jgi:energy-converting hydrogenase A subunit D
MPEVPRMNELLILVFGAMVVLGAIATIISRDLFDKLISLGIIVAGIMPFLADRGLLDVLAATALIAPLSTIFILMAIRRKKDGS